MITGVVIGNVVSTVQHPFYAGKKLLMVEKTRNHGERTGDYLLAVDHAGAGAGEHVLVLDEGNGARQIVGDAQAPLRSIIVGIIDEIEITKT
jgi:ethanolamine utilization protein EutN